MFIISSFLKQSFLHSNLCFLIFHFSIFTESLCDIICICFCRYLKRFFSWLIFCCPSNQKFFWSFRLWWWQIKNTSSIGLKISYSAKNLITIICWIVTKCLGSLIFLDSFYKCSCICKFLTDHILLSICKMFNFTKSDINIFNYFIKLRVVNIKLSIIEVSVFTWLTN